MTHKSIGMLSREARAGAWVLSDPRGPSSLTVRPDRGGMLVDWRWAEEPLLYLDPDTLEDPSGKVRGGVPILFPICGPLQDGTCRVLGQQCRMGQHGVARTAAWQVLEPHGEGLVLELDGASQFLESFPWPFRLTVEYRLEGSVLDILLRAENRSDQVMPCQLGLHPYFLISERAALELSGPGTEYLDNTQPQRPAGQFSGPGLPAGVSVIDWEFQDTSPTAVVLVDRGRGLRLRVEWQAPFRYFVLWNLEDRRFCCLEPWTGPRFGFASGQDRLDLSPGEAVEAHCWFSVERI